MQNTLAQTIVRFTSLDMTAESSLKDYTANLKNPDTLHGMMLIGKKDTLYSFRSVNSRIIVFKRDKQLVFTELYAIPIPSGDDYYYVPLREFTVNTSGTVVENNLFLKSQLSSQKQDSEIIRAEYEDLRKEIAKQVRIDEYDEVLVHRTAVLVWDLTLSALSGNEEFYSLLTNVETEFPSVVAGESGYAWRDCRYLLHSEKVDGFQ